MDSFTDYYAVLGVARDAPNETIKSAFKKLAHQYHPDVYKGVDANERTRALVQAYKTLNDPSARKQYDMQRSEHLLDGRVTRVGNNSHSARRPSRAGTTEVSPSARRDRQRYYDFPDLYPDSSAHIDLIEREYQLSPVEAQNLLLHGLLRGIAPTVDSSTYGCHRCHHRWPSAAARGQNGALPRSCPKCHTTDWSEYLLLHCTHCCAIFESEQIRYEIGAYSYGKSQGGDKQADQTDLCPPYELFPLCPYCGTAHWCPAEDVRVSELRQQAARRAAIARMIWMSVIVVVIVLLGVVALTMFR